MKEADFKERKLRRKECNCVEQNDDYGTKRMDALVVEKQKSF